MVAICFREALPLFNLYIAKDIEETPEHDPTSPPQQCFDGSSSLLSILYIPIVEVFCLTWTHFWGSTKFTRFDAVTSLYVSDSGGQRSSLNQWKGSRPRRSYVATGPVRCLDLCHRLKLKVSTTLCSAFIDFTSHGKHYVQQYQQSRNSWSYFWASKR